MTSNRIFALLVAFVLMFSVAACDGGGGDGIDTGGATDPIPQGDPNAGRDAFILGTDPACGDCHTLADAGTTATVGPNLDELQPSFEQVIDAMNTGPGEMPAFADLSQDVKENIAAYVSTFAGQGQ